MHVYFAATSGAPLTDWWTHWKVLFAYSMARMMYCERFNYPDIDKVVHGRWHSEGRYTGQNGHYGHASLSGHLPLGPSEG